MRYPQPEGMLLIINVKKHADVNRKCTENKVRRLSNTSTSPSSSPTDLSHTLGKCIVVIH